MLRELGEGDARRRFRWRPEDHWDAERSGSGCSVRAVRRKDFHRGRRLKREPDRPAEGLLIVATRTVQRNFAHAELAVVSAGGAPARRAAAAHRAVANMDRGTAEDARKDRERARKCEGQDERKHHEVRPLPARGTHGRQATARGTPGQCRAYGSRRADAQAVVSVSLCSQLVMQTYRESP